MNEKSTPPPKKKSYIIVGIIYRHPKMDATKFSNNLKKLLKTINQEQRIAFLFDGFNIDLVHCNEHKPTKKN